MTQASTEGPLKPKLHLCNGYAANFTSLARILIIACQDSRKLIPQADLIAAVGLTEKHVKYLCGIAQAFGVIEQRTCKATPLGQLIYKYDPFFDDIGTLWFLHYMVSSNLYHLIWHRLMTSIMPTNKRITIEQAYNAFDDLHQDIGGQSIRKHILNELNSIFDAYTNQHFVRLNYLDLEEGAYFLKKNPAVPPLVLGACIARFRDLHRLGDTAISIPDLLTDPNGPGVVLQLEEGRLRTLLELLKKEPGFSLESRADLDQVRLTDNIPDHTWMERYYVNFRA
ncbi:MAG TPA: DUF4007 family protein [Ktedonobacteraceae bacterium]|nr:DUF4007 family protein [Ktedonobacteraceae bacterium]